MDANVLFTCDLENLFGNFVKKLHKFLEIFDSPCCEFEEEDVIEAAKEAFNKVTNS